MTAVNLSRPLESLQPSDATQRKFLTRGTFRFLFPRHNGNGRTQQVKCRQVLDPLCLRHSPSDLVLVASLHCTLLDFVLSPSVHHQPFFRCSPRTTYIGVQTQWIPNFVAGDSCILSDTMCCTGPSSCALSILRELAGCSKNATQSACNRTKQMRQHNLMPRA